MNDTPQEKVQEQAPPVDWPTAAVRPPCSGRESRSMFGPVLLIALGIYFLLNNLGLADSLNWAAALQLWPLLLIFLGLNIIVRQAPRPVGSLLSGVVGLTAVAVFSFVLLAAPENALLRRLGVGTNENAAPLQRQEVDYAPGDIETAVVNIDFGAPAADLYALEDSRSLLAGVVTYGDEFNLDTREEGSRAFVDLDTRENNWFFWFNPTNWVRATEEDKWQLGLNPDIAYDLELDVGAGQVDFDLHPLTLTEFTLDGGAGYMEVRLPDGAYDADIDIGAGALNLWLPGDGRQSIELDGGAGRVTLHLPAGVEARLIVDDGAGSFRLDDGRFTQVSGNEPDDGIWETAGYDEAADRLELRIDIGAGGVSIQTSE